MRSGLPRPCRREPASDGGNIIEPLQLAVDSPGELGKLFRLGLHLD